MRSTGAGRTWEEQALSEQPPTGWVLWGGAGWESCHREGQQYEGAGEPPSLPTRQGSRAVTEPAAE
jgi:hypothetical protein